MRRIIEKNVWGMYLIIGYEEEKGDFMIGLYSYLLPFWFNCIFIYGHIFFKYI